MTNAGSRRGRRYGLLGLSAIIAVGLGSLAACGTSSNDPKPTPTPSAAAAVSVTDPWVKSADKGMTAAFATLVNNTDKDLTVVSAATAAAGMVELHEVVDLNGSMVMRPKVGGFVIAAHGKHVLQPGGDHIMLMDVKQPLKPGAEVSFTLTFSDGTTTSFTALVKDFAGGKESYKPSMSPMAGMS